MPVLHPGETGYFSEKCKMRIDNELDPNVWQQARIPVRHYPVHHRKNIGLANYRA